VCRQSCSPTGSRPAAVQVFFARVASPPESNGRPLLLVKTKPSPPRPWASRCSRRCTRSVSEIGPCECLPCSSARSGRPVHPTIAQPESHPPQDRHAPNPVLAAHRGGGPHTTPSPTPPDPRAEQPRSAPPPPTRVGSAPAAAEAAATTTATSGSHRPHPGRASADRSPATARSHSAPHSENTPCPPTCQQSPAPDSESHPPTEDGRTPVHPPAQLPFITAKRRRLIRRPRPRPNLPPLRRRKPLRRNLTDRDRTRRPHRLFADRRLALLPPRPRLRQRTKRPPNRPPITPRPPRPASVALVT
jgi:hypothetical protein